MTSGQVTGFLKSSGSVIRANSQTADIYIDDKGHNSDSWFDNE